MARKNFAATGSFIAEDRPRALDLLGFSSQLVFNTFHNRRLRDWEHAGDLDLAYGAARAHNRGMVEFCSVDPRLLPTCYVPLVDFDRAAAMADEAIAMGAAALLVASGCPPGHSPSHVGLDPVWARAQEAGDPVVFHVGGTGDLIDRALLPTTAFPCRPTSTAARRTSARSTTWASPGRPAQTLATMIFDGVLERFPGLRRRRHRAGSHLGARRGSGRWRRPSRPSSATRSGYGRSACGPPSTCRRQVRVTPYPTEDVGWIIEQSGPEVCMFSSDYPHVEGGRRPHEVRGSLGPGREARQRSTGQLPRPHGHAAAALVS